MVSTASRPPNSRIAFAYATRVDLPVILLLLLLLLPQPALCYDAVGV